MTHHQPRHFANLPPSTFYIHTPHILGIELEVGFALSSASSPCLPYHLGGQFRSHIVRSTCGKDSLQSVPTSDMKVLYLFPLRGPCCALAIFSPPSCRVIFKYEGCPLLRLSCPAINRYLPESLVLAQRWRDCGNKKVPLSSKPGIPIHIHPADVSMRNITRGTTGSNIEGLNQSTPMTAFTHSSYQSQLCTFFSGQRTF